MTGDMEWRQMKKTLLGASLIVAPLLILVGQLIASSVYDGDDQGRFLASIAAHETAHYAGNIVSACGTLFLVGATVALVHLIRVRHMRFAVGAGFVALLGAVTIPGIWLAFTIFEHLAAQEPSRAAMAALFDNAEDSSATVPLFVAWIGTSLGLLLLAGGLLWSRTAPRWMAALVAAGAVIVFVGESDVLSIAGGVLLLAGLGAIGATIVRSSVEEWEAGDLTHLAPPAPRPSTPPPAVPAH